ncbi:MAG: divalent metal cation transporter [Myxococcales bacterium]|nr:divalent metal cation transporter [Myxococcales bacterium]
MESQRTLAKAIGPGLLFAGAAIGASHLVQSTRAGASFGLALVAVVIAANIVKYPAFSFGPRYSAATGLSLLEGYRRQGRWALVLYGVVTVLSVFTIQSAVSFVTAGLAIALLEVDWDPLWLSAAIMALCLGLLRVGCYRWLDRIVKVAVLLLTLGTVVAAALVLPRIDWGQALWPSSELFTNSASFFFIAALIGWMPTAVDVSVWHSLWTLAKRRDTGHKPSVSESLIDFNIGYIGTAILGICFLLLGAGVVYGRDIALPAGAAGFSAAVIGLYTELLGGWARPVFGFAAFLVMFSTTLTVVDGFPRAISAFIDRWQRPEKEGEAVGTSTGRNYWISALAITVGAMIILSQFLANLKSLVDLATTISLVTAPPLAWLGHRAIFGPDLEGSDRPSFGMYVFSLVAIGIQVVLSLYYLYVRFL